MQDLTPTLPDPNAATLSLVTIRNMSVLASLPADYTVRAFVGAADAPVDA